MALRRTLLVAAMAALVVAVAGADAVASGAAQAEVVATGMSGGRGVTTGVSEGRVVTAGALTAGEPIASRDLIAVAPMPGGSPGSLTPGRGAAPVAARFIGVDRTAALERDLRPSRRPRRYPAPRSARQESGPSLVTQLAAGFYNPSGAPDPGFLLSARVGPQIDPHVRLGVLLEWAHKADRVSVTFGRETVGGVDLALEDSRLRGQSDLVPLLGFLEVSGDPASPVIPYGGFGAGLEILAMEAERPDGRRFEGTFTGFGWQLWAGAGLPLASEARLSGEVFYNHADLGRDVRVDGRDLRQTASFHGLGMRFGVAWRF